MLAVLGAGAGGYVPAQNTHGAGHGHASGMHHHDEVTAMVDRGMMMEQGRGH